MMFLCILFGVPREDENTRLMKDLDWPGPIDACLGLSLLYMALGQGNCWS